MYHQNIANYSKVKVYRDHYAQFYLASTSRLLHLSWIFRSGFSIHCSSLLVLWQFRLMTHLSRQHSAAYCSEKEGMTALSQEFRVSIVFARCRDALLILCSPDL